MSVLSSIQNAHLHYLILNWLILFSDTFNNYCHKFILFISFLNFSSTAVYKQYSIHKIKSNINIERKFAAVYFIYHISKYYDKLLNILYFPKHVHHKKQKLNKREKASNSVSRCEFCFDVTVLTIDLSLLVNP